MSPTNRTGRRQRIATTARHPTPFVALDPADRQPLHRQLYDAIRAAIMNGRLPARSRLPSTRALAEELGVSRVTVSTAFDQLQAEGYIAARTGSGTFVRDGVPDDAFHPRRAARPAKLPRTPPIAPTAPLPAPPDAGQPIRAGGSVGAVAFRTGTPALDLFPTTTWARLTSRRWRTSSGAEAGRLLGYGSPLGYEPLRRAIADYVTLSRGVRCEARQVIITGGAQQALALASRTLLRPGEAAWLEDPGYFGAREALQAAGATIVPVPVDEEGLDPAVGERLAPDARLAYVSPSHQFPLGVTMSMRRRVALLDWAARAGAWLIEDDYDGEFRYVGRPLASLQGLDVERQTGEAASSHGRVLYVGTFSKTLFPSLRLGYLIVPEALMDMFATAKTAAMGQNATVEQAVLTDFIEEGHYARHVRRMRLIYAARQERLIAEAATHLSPWLVLQEASAGMHLVGWLRHDRLPADVSDRTLSSAAHNEGLVLTALSSYRTHPIPPVGEAAPRGGLVFGYSGCPEEMIEDGVRRLARAISSCLATRSRTGRSPS